MSIKDGFEHIFPSVIVFSEKNCRPLFATAEDGSFKFWVAVSDNLTYMNKTLMESGYRKYPEKEYMNCICLPCTDVTVELPSGFRFCYGDAYPDEANKWSALRLGFHPEYETQDYRASMNPYIGRKQSSLYADSFECIVADEETTEKSNVCAYCFVYVDQRIRTALIEPVSTREKYRRKGIGTTMMHGAIIRCKQLGIEKCYVDAFGRRKDFYISTGFFTENSTSFWYKTLN